MPIEITMPKLTDTMTEATLAKWLKKEGDAIKPGDMIAEVETDKATQELEAFEAGTIARIMVPEGGKTPVGALITVLAQPDEDVAQVAAEYEGAIIEPRPRREEVKPRVERLAEQPAGPVMPGPEEQIAVEDHHEGSEPEALVTEGGSGGRISPLARKIAEEKGIDVTTLRGSGPDGRIVKRDVMEAVAHQSRDRKGATGSALPHGRFLTGAAPMGTVQAAGPSTAAQAGPSHLAVKLEQKNFPLSNMRQTIARRLLQSKQYIPHFYLSIDIIMDSLLNMRTQLNEQMAVIGEKISVTDFIARAAVMALTRVPAVNSSFAETAIIQHGTVDLGIAVAVEEGLVVPVVRQAHTKSVRQLTQEIKQLAELGRARKLKADQMTGSTFTISNMGMFGIKNFHAIINPPESAILAVGGTTWQPVIKEIDGNRQIVPAQVMHVSLSADHRVVDGATGARFLQEVKAILESPMSMLL
ncbi:MAG: 2-oxo acid dehydrogenase subunit E2 [Phycisphaerales bacterium]|nr:2-oxo acid dehydrogenase subunit E2 [Phycisphaerales bacterium]